MLAPPMALLLELTHRCPLACPYCSNPLQLAGMKQEMNTAGWREVIRQAAEMGVLQIHFSGGEPTLRKDLPELIAYTRELGLYSNLITSGVATDEAALDHLLACGLDHVQLSIQDATVEGADHISGYRNSLQKKSRFAEWLKAREVPSTLNAVIHRQNIHNLPAMIDLAMAWGVGRLEVAHTQYYGWGLRNRAALMPTREQLEQATAIVLTARERYHGELVIDYVTPDYYARRPKPCMAGWARRFMNITPTGEVLPCHAAETIPGLVFDNVRQRSLADIWSGGEAFLKFRGTEWMPEPCQSCPKKELDWGGCRCQALALSGRADTLDPVCERSPDHERIQAMAEQEAARGDNAFVYRRPEKSHEAV